MSQVLHLQKPSEERLAKVARDKSEVKVRSTKESSLDQGELHYSCSSICTRVIAAFEDVSCMYSLVQMQKRHVPCMQASQNRVRTVLRGTPGLYRYVCPPKGMGFRPSG